MHSFVTVQTVLCFKLIFKEALKKVVNFPLFVKLPLFFSACLGRSHAYINSSVDEIGWSWNLPPYHPLRLINLISHLGGLALVPYCYWKIFSFIKKHNLEMNRLLRKEQFIKKRQINLVNIKYNLAIWVLDILSLLVVFIFSGELPVILYVLLVSCSHPVLYFLGIEETKKSV